MQGVSSTSHLKRFPGAQRGHEGILLGYVSAEPPERCIYGLTVDQHLHP